MENEIAESPTDAGERGVEEDGGATLTNRAALACVKAGPVEASLLREIVRGLRERSNGCRRPEKLEVENRAQPIGTSPELGSRSHADVHLLRGPVMCRAASARAKAYGLQSPVSSCKVGAQKAQRDQEEGRRLADGQREVWDFLDRLN
jgi:hypothetical protein